MNTMIVLPEYIERKWPGSLVGGYRPGRLKYRVHCKWRGDDRKPSGVLTYVQNGWVWYDHTTGQGGGLMDFLMLVEGLSEAEAKEVFKSTTTGGTPSSSGKGECSTKYNKSLANPKGFVNREGINMQKQKLSSKSLFTLKRAQKALLEQGLPETWKGRGLDLDDAVRYGLGRIEEDTLIPILGPDGEVTHVKRRYKEENENHGKYGYIEPGLGAPCWFNTDFHNPGAKFIVLIEGEGKAISLDNALYYRRKAWDREEYLSIVGVPGTSAKIPWDVIIDEAVRHGKHVVFVPEYDTAGQQAIYGTPEKEGWEDALRARLKERGVKGVEVYVTHPVSDVCDIAGAFTEKYGHEKGNAILGEELFKLIDSAVKGHDIRMRAKQLSATPISPQLLKMFGRRYHSLAYMLQYLIFLLAKGQFIMPKAYGMNIAEEFADFPLVRFSFTKAAQALGTPHRRQGIRAVEYSKENIGLIPMPKGLFPFVTTVYGYKDTSIYAIPPAILEIYGSDNGFFAVRDANRKSKQVAAPLGVRGQLAVQLLRRLGAMSFRQLAEHLRIHGNAARRLVERLQAHGIATVVDGVVHLAENWYEAFEGYLNRLKKIVQENINRLWQSVHAPHKPTKFWGKWGAWTPPTPTLAS